MNGKPAYKSAFLGKTLYYAERGNNDGFEERHIVSTDTYEIADISFSDFVQVETEKLTQTTAELLERFTTSMTRWARKGFKIADAKTLSKRKAICSQCENWKPQGFLGFGKCSKCGCSSAKLRLETECCPIQKW